MLPYPTVNSTGSPLTPDAQHQEYIKPRLSNQMQIPFVIILSCLFIFLFGALLRFLYKVLYHPNLHYVQHKEADDVPVKEVELPPLGIEWDYDEQAVQDDPNMLIDV